MRTAYQTVPHKIECPSKDILIIEDKKMKIKTSYTERDLDFCYSVLIATVTAMFVIVMIWKVIA